MGFRNRGRSRSSVKHVVDSEGTAVSGTNSQTPIGTVITTRSAVFNPVELITGEHVYGFFLSIFLIGTTGAPVNGAANWYIAKRRDGQEIIGDFPAPGSTGASKVRNQIFHEEKGLIGSGDGTAMAFKGVVKVPKGMQRCREGDEFFIRIRMTGTDDSQFCIKAIYKSFT